MKQKFDLSYGRLRKRFKSNSQFQLLLNRLGRGGARGRPWKHQLEKQGTWRPCCGFLGHYSQSSQTGHSSLEF